MSQNITDHDILLILLEDIDAVEEYVAGLTREAFLQDCKTRDAVARRLEEIGGLVRMLSAETKERAPHIAWGELVRMGHLLMYEYAYVDFARVWETAIQQLPSLKQAVQELLGH